MAYWIEQEKWLEQSGFERVGLLWMRDKFWVKIDDSKCTAMCFEYEDTGKTAKESLENLSSLLKETAECIEAARGELARYGILGDRWEFK
jgi:hypothetical protein